MPSSVSGIANVPRPPLCGTRIRANLAATETHMCGRTGERVASEEDVMAAGWRSRGVVKAVALWRGGGCGCGGCGCGCGDGRQDLVDRAVECARFKSRLWQLFTPRILHTQQTY